MKIKSDNAWKMLITLPGTEKILVNVDPLLTIDVLTQLWPTGGPWQKFPSILFPLPPNPGSSAIATGGRGAMILTGLHWAHPRPVGGASSQVPHAKLRPVGQSGMFCVAMVGKFAPPFSAPEGAVSLQPHRNCEAVSPHPQGARSFQVKSNSGVTGQNSCSSGRPWPGGQGCQALGLT